MPMQMPKPQIRYRRPIDQKASRLAEPARHHVYFMRAGDFIKIGTTNNLMRRLMVLQIGCPLPVSLEVAILGGAKLEKAIHDRFLPYRRHGEWFHAADDIQKFMAKCLDRVQRANVDKWQKAAFCKGCGTYGRSDCNETEARKARAPIWRVQRQGSCLTCRIKEDSSPPLVLSSP